MKNLNITDEVVKQAFKNAGKDGKQVLTDLFGKQFSLYDNITEMVKSFEDACQVLGISTNVPDVKGLSCKHQMAIIANYKLIIIAEALNEGWMPNWQDSNEYKYFPWFKVNRDAAGFSCSTTYNTAAFAYANVGSRLCCKSDELATYFGKQFIDLWNDSLLFH